MLDPNLEVHNVIFYDVAGFHIPETRWYRFLDSLTYPLSKKRKEIFLETLTV